ncbi:hypothetical protein acdb102_31310 [Acidothermaceae bacterium B102]|nr:hypothetical protein acdb102_31310 [Acidothermaceae bacterium B102]
MGARLVDSAAVAAMLTVPGSAVFIVAATRRFFSFTSRLEETLKPDAQGRTISERLDDTQAEVNEIKKQVLPNGGSSLRDAVNRAVELAEKAVVSADTAKQAATESAEQANRAEIMGNFERRDIRQKLDSIETKMDAGTHSLTTHLVDAAAKTEVINARLSDIEHYQRARDDQ